MANDEAVAILGGSFDPVHLAHTAAAEAVINAMEGRVTVYFMPCAQAPHKKAFRVNDCDRLAMLELAIREKKHMQLDLREMHRDRVSYSVDSLRDIRAERGQDVSINFVMGWDVWKNLETWHQWLSVFSLTNIIVLQRPGYAHLLSDSLRAQWQQRNVNVQQLGQHSSGKIAYIEDCNLDISATQVREFFSRIRSRIKSDENERVWHMLNKSLDKNVMDYIIQNELYGCRAENMHAIQNK